MVDSVDLQKTFSPIASTAKVKQVKRRHTAMQQKKFAQHLREERKEDKDEECPEEKDVSKRKDSRMVMGENEQCTSTTEDKDLDEGSTGKLIDIVV